ncbi:MAG: hypothetical protein AAGU27_26890 [Dehalobacterium sp.]
MYYYKTKIPVGQSTDTFAQSYDYYDDHGNLLLIKNYDYDQSKYITETYGYDSCKNLAWVKNAKSNMTNYTCDEWDWVKEITDCPGE